MVRLLTVAIGRPTFDVEFGADHVDQALAVVHRCAVRDDELTVTTLEPDGGKPFFTDGITLDAALEAATAGGAPDIVLVLQATFSDSSMVGDVADRLGVPIVVWSFPEARTGERLRLNSLCGANLAAYLLRRRGHPVEFLHADPTADAAGRQLATTLTEVVAAPVGISDDQAGPSRDTELGRRLASMFTEDRIGVIGDPPPGFEPCEGDPGRLRVLTDIDVERVPLEALFDRSVTVSDPERHAIARRIHSTMVVDPTVESAGMAESVDLYGGLRSLVAEHRWTAVATRCWPECMTEFGGAVCTPMAMLTENGVPAVCEADMYGAATSLLLHHVAGSDPFLADLVDADRRDDTSVLWHCGVAPTTLADPDEPVTGITHPNRHVALANQFALRPGRVTVARLSQAGGRVRLVLGGGEMLSRPRPFQGTCGVLQWDEPVADVLATVFGLGLEHHLGVVYGDHREALASLADEWGIPTIWLGHDER